MSEKETKTKAEKTIITVAVFAPNATESKAFSWPKTTKVGEAAQEAAQAFGFAPGQPTLAKEGEALDPQKPLVAAGVEDADELELVDSGGGV